MKITFLRKEQFDMVSEEYFYIYTQDAANKTHIARCMSTPYSKDINCSDNSNFSHINYKINNFTATAFFPNYGENFLHLVATVYEDFPNEVFIYDVEAKKMFSKPIILGKDW